MTDDVPVATPVLATISVPTAAQGVARIPLDVPIILDSVTGSRSPLPDFIVREHKDNEMLKSHKYKSGFARTIAPKFNFFVDNTSGYGHSTLRQNLPIMQHQVRQQGTRPFKQSRKTAVINPPFYANGFSAPIGSAMSKTQFKNLPRSVCKGGSEFKMGRGRNFVCALCFIVGHTFEYCSTHNGFVEGGPAITTDPRTRAAGRTLAITSQ